MEVPGLGLVKGEWDLRPGVRAYLGNVELRGKRVLELGTASGYLCFEMERQGAEVIAYDLSPAQDWDVVPYARTDNEAWKAERKKHIERLNNAWRFAHAALGSKARVVYGSVYEVPESIGPVDVATFGSILLHVRDPFLALQKALALTRETVIVTDLLPHGYRAYAAARSLAEKVPVPRVQRMAKLSKNYAEFVPDAARGEPREVWWNLTPDVVARMIAVLGFEDVEVTFHTQRYLETDAKMFTVVGRRRR
jgi:hypothetical protein